MIRQITFVGKLCISINYQGHDITHQNWYNYNAKSTTRKYTYYPSQEMGRDLIPCVNLTMAQKFKS
jgi:hypothetical protein